MRRAYPWALEPFVYLIQTPTAFRIVGLGGLAVFTILSLDEAAAAGSAYFVIGIVLLGAVWLDASVNVCRRCRFYGTWHCLGQGMMVSKLLSPARPPLASRMVTIHFVLLSAYLLYGFFWLWQSPRLGLLFTLWVPIALLSATPPGGFSWRKVPAASTAA